jgi:hypothetical protein
VSNVYRCIYVELGILEIVSREGYIYQCVMPSEALWLSCAAQILLLNPGAS